MLTRNPQHQESQCESSRPPHAARSEQRLPAWPVLDRGRSFPDRHQAAAPLNMPRTAQLLKYYIDLLWQYLKRVHKIPWNVQVRVIDPLHLSFLLTTYFSFLILSNKSKYSNTTPEPRPTLHEICWPIIEPGQRLHALHKAWQPACNFCDHSSQSRIISSAVAKPWQYLNFGRPGPGPKLRPNQGLELCVSII